MRKITVHRLNWHKIDKAFQNSIIVSNQASKAVTKKFKSLIVFSFIWKKHHEYTPNILFSISEWRQPSRFWQLFFIDFFSFYPHERNENENIKYILVLRAFVHLEIEWNSNGILSEFFFFVIFNESMMTLHWCALYILL